MNNKTRLKNLLVIATAIFLLTGRQCYATSYASDLTNSAGIVSFRLNDNADNVKIISSGGAVTNDLGPVVKGLTVTNLGIASGHIKVMVTRSAPAGYTQISSDAFQDNGIYVNKFEQPRGVVVNKNPASPSFGRIYVSNARAASTATPARDTFDGIYVINSDNTVALDTGTTPRTAGLAFSTGTETASPLRLTIGKDDNLLYICDLSDPSGGLWVTDLDVTAGTNVFDVIGDLGFGATTHGSIYAAVAEGTLAGSNLKIFTMDEDLTPIRSAWRYEVNGGPLPFTGTATSLGQAMINTAIDLAKGGSSNYLYASQNRSAGTDAPSIQVFTADGTTITNSLDASRAYLGNPSAADLFRNTVALDMSPDGGTLALLRGVSFGQVLLVPLTNGVFNFAATNSFSYGASGPSDSTRDLAYDAAGNIYVISSSFEWLRTFSRGGATIATTGTDGTFVMATPPTLISVSATVAAANEQGPANGQFSVTRTGDSSSSLTVSYTMSGTASNGTDYAALSGSVTFLPGAISTNITVSVADDAAAELTETAILTLSASANYGIATGSATVSILDNEGPEISFSTVVTNKLLESYAPSKVTLQLARRGLLTPALTASLSFSGAATRGGDFDAPLSVAFGANVATANIALTPINDQAYEGDELAVVSVASGAGYAIGATNSASALVIDDEYPAGVVLFSDNFSTDTSALWQANLADPSDGFVEFAWDYGTLAGIPAAPGTTDGTTRGMRIRCGNVTPQPSAVSLSPLGGSFTGNYRLKFDMWINYNGPMPDGGAGSTQHFDAGVGTVGNTVVWYNNPSADGVWFTCSGDGADGNIFGDYSAYIGLTTQNDDTGFYAAGTGVANSGLRDNAHPFYTSLWGGQAAPAAQLALYPGQTGVANLGNAGMAWHTVVITKAADTVKWQLDGITICTVTNDPGNLANNVFVGYQDRFAVSLSDVPEMSFGLVDNLRVETFLSSPVSITNIKIVGGNVEITFTGPTEALAAAFKLQSAALVGGTYLDDNSATLTTLGPGSFKATTALSGANRFYRLKF